MKKNELETPEKKSLLSGIQKFLTRDEMKKVNGGYSICPGPGYTCMGYVCQYTGQFISPDWCNW